MQGLDDLSEENLIHQVKNAVAKEHDKRRREQERIQEFENKDS